MLHESNGQDLLNSFSLRLTHEEPEFVSDKPSGSVATITNIFNSGNGSACDWLTFQGPCRAKDNETRQSSKTDMTAIETTEAQPAATALGIQLAGLQTETRNPRTTAIDRVSTEELCRIFHREDSRVHKAVEPCIPTIAQAIEAVTERLRRGGRLFYIGAGTSGRYVKIRPSKLPLPCLTLHLAIFAEWRWRLHSLSPCTIPAKPKRGTPD